MKKLSIALVLLSTLSIAASADEIPKAFQGKWATTKAVCTSKGPEAEAIVTIGRKSYEGYEIFCKIKKIKSATSSSLAASGTCNQEGAENPATLKFELLNEGRAISIGDEKYIKCGG